MHLVTFRAQETIADVVVDDRIVCLNDRVTCSVDLYELISAYGVQVALLSVYLDESLHPFVFYGILRTVNHNVVVLLAVHFDDDIDALLRVPEDEIYFYGSDPLVDPG